MRQRGGRREPRRSRDRGTGTATGAEDREPGPGISGEVDHVVIAATDAESLTWPRISAVPDTLSDWLRQDARSQLLRFPPATVPDSVTDRKSTRCCPFIQAPAAIPPSL